MLHVRTAVSSLAMPSQSPSIARVIEAARGVGLEIVVADFPESTKTAADAAAAIGCDVAAIVKSLVFTVDGEAVVALVPGDRRLDTAALAALADGSIVERAPIDLVREATGFVAGGTPPFGHVHPLRVFADDALRRHDPVWAAAGTPTTVFPITIDDLDRVASPRWGRLS
jgi:Cys-tRNA(Pro) deacylase